MHFRLVNMRANATPRSYSGVLDSFTAHQTNSTSALLLMCLLTCLPPQQFSTKLSEGTREKEGEKEAAAECELVCAHGDLLACTVQAFVNIQYPGLLVLFVHVNVGQGVLQPRCVCVG